VRVRVRGEAVDHSPGLVDPGQRRGVDDDGRIVSDDADDLRRGKRGGADEDRGRIAHVSIPHPPGRRARGFVATCVCDPRHLRDR